MRLGSGEPCCVPQDWRAKMDARIASFRVVVGILAFVFLMITKPSGTLV